MTIIIVIITAIISVIGFSNRELTAKLMFNPYLLKHGNQWYRVFTHAFIHSGWMHLAVNMWVLWNFGGLVEHFFDAERGSAGSIGFIALYVGGILFATLPSYMRHQDNFSYNSLGASGAVSAVLYASIFYDPTMGIYLMFIPIPIPAIAFGILYLALEWYLDKKSNDNVAHDAHFWGAMFGFTYALLMVPGHLKVFSNMILDYFL